LKNTLNFVSPQETNILLHAWRTTGLTFHFCFTECYGVGHHNGPLAGNRSIDARNIEHFNGCNVVKGSLSFNTLSFNGW